MYTRVLTIAIILVVFSTSAIAGTPNLVSYQGRLTNAAGTAISGTMKLTFLIYDVLQGGSPIWTEIHDSINVTDGQFSVALGISSLISDEVFSGSERYLGIRVGDDSEIIPRTQLLSVPYSFHTKSLDGAVGGEITNGLKINGSPAITLPISSPGWPISNWLITHQPMNISKTGLTFRNSDDAEPLMSIYYGGGVVIGGSIGPISSPQGALHIAAKGTAIVIGPTSMAAGETAALLFKDMDNSTPPIAIQYADNGNPTLYVVGGNFSIGVANPANPFELSNGAYCSSAGVWTNASDRNKKEHFESVDGSVILEQLERLPIRKWRFKGDKEGITHIGPISQEFHAIFGVGNDTLSISTVDPSGIALAAIKQLHKESLLLLKENSELMAQNIQLRKEFEQFKREIESTINKK